jgi:hypothetical protein
MRPTVIDQLDRRKSRAFVWSEPELDSPTEHHAGDDVTATADCRDADAWLLRLIAAGEVFLMNRQSPDSLDGRYFGPLPTTTIVGRADPLWTHEKD